MAAISVFSGGVMGGLLLMEWCRTRHGMPVEARAMQHLIGVIDNGSRGFAWSFMSAKPVWFMKF
jgi:hypothetical protein